MSGLGVPDSVRAGLGRSLDAARWADRGDGGAPLEVRACSRVGTDAWWLLVSRGQSLYQLLVDEQGRDLLTHPTGDTAAGAGSLGVAEVAQARQQLLDLLGAGVWPQAWKITDRAGGLLPHPSVVTALSVEQSNTTLRVSPADGGAEVALKLLRRPVPGLGVEVPLLEQLGRARNQAVPALRGWATVDVEGQQLLVAVGQDFIPDAEDVFALFADPGIDVSAAVALAAQVGRAVAGIHRDIAGGCAPAQLSADDVCARLRQRLDGPRAAGPEVADACRRAQQLYEQALHDRRLPEAVAVAVQPVHGDLHFGQMLCTGDAAQAQVRVLDFEGEPARSVEQRRALSPVEQDVAGLVRSADYAASLRGGSPQEVRDYATQVEQALVAGYQEVARLSTELLELYVVDKAVYELAYELAHRPAMAGIPRAALQRLL